MLSTNATEQQTRKPPTNKTTFQSPNNTYKTRQRSILLSKWTYTMAIHTHTGSRKSNQSLWHTGSRRPTHPRLGSLAANLLSTLRRQAENSNNTSKRMGPNNKQLVHHRMLTTLNKRPLRRVMARKTFTKRPIPQQTLHILARTTRRMPSRISPYNLRSTTRHFR